MIEDIIVNNNEFGYVDLGLPSGTKWATMNVGAHKPSDPGLYFQWGDTEGYKEDQVGTRNRQKEFTWGDYKWSINGSFRNFSRYTTNRKVLELEDDAAHVHMGGDWHIPSYEQFKELIDGTTHVWARLDGVSGMVFISKKDTPNSIFISAAGVACDSRVIFKGSYGFYLIIYA